ncbi:MAG: putative hydrophobic protein (TIGR00271 family) [Bacteroidia bacterium]|jgi:uncharacterized hydrophobic protein (TIGR00271 family)
MENPKVDKQEIKEEQSKTAMQFGLLRFVVALKDFASSRLNLADDADLEGTAEIIKKDIDFKGASVYILVCSIFIASIGLNVNSAAVVIGAMLISPLMGPILGIGFSVGTNDWETLKSALRNFGVMVVVSLIASTLYFLITPLREVQPELLARTKPTFLDALIAIFGGLAGIIGVSRSVRGNVVPGVAIATALMPPLCTAGYGLANMDLKFFLGAFYLFSLNSIFICIATFIITRYLKFPLVSFVNAESERKVKQYIGLFVIVILLPSAYIFYGVVKETIYLNRAEQFVAENFDFEGTEILNSRVSYNDSLSRIDIFIMGENIAAQAQETLRNRMAEYKLINTSLKIHQPKDMSGDVAGRLSNEVRVGIVEDLYRKNEEIMSLKDEQINKLQQVVDSYKKDSIPFENIYKEVGTLYPEINQLSFAPSVEMTETGLDTIPTFIISWKNGMDSKIKSKKRETLEDWLKQRLELDTARVIEF